ncbi:two-component system response regulator CreB [Methylomarinum vadi]|uniref:two-component system response regulator CreB n=1 Tax=Methylomarinum vadi TaxID=438855 RepID=UPI001F2EAADD|nr:two-component system response regulator CreB [Methylomarinum vadi]
MLPTHYTAEGYQTDCCLVSLTFVYLLSINANKRIFPTELDNASFKQKQCYSALIVSPVSPTDMATILIVDDEPSIVDNITFALETEGFSVVSASTGNEAIAELADRQFDLLILDIGLPDMNGFDLARQIRASSVIPLIFLTARSDEIDRVVGLELGGDDYVTKPFSPRELSARVKAVLRRTTQHSSLNSAAKDLPAFTIDQEKLRISYRDTPLELSRTEYRLLKVLLQAPGRVFSREQLLDIAWEHGGISLERTVDTHIKMLRQKLKAVYPDDDPIVTHRGIGYSLRDDR